MEPEEYFEGPSTSTRITAGDICVFCVGDKGPISDKDLSNNLTKKGLVSIINACEERQDDVAKIILLHRRKSASEFPFKFHSSCRSIYTDSKRILYAKRCCEESHLLQRDESDLAPPPTKRLSRQETAKFDWNLHRFICLQVQDTYKKKAEYFLLLI